MDELTYIVEGFQFENDDGRVRRHALDARRPITRVRLLVTLDGPARCDHDESEAPIDRTFVVVDADGETPATAAALVTNLQLAIPCATSEHQIIVTRGKGAHLDVVHSHGNPWPTNRRHIARVVP
jgi:hypothetical protein